MYLTSVETIINSELQQMLLPSIVVNLSSVKTIILSPVETVLFIFNVLILILVIIIAIILKKLWNQSKQKMLANIRTESIIDNDKFQDIEKRIQELEENDNWHTDTIRRLISDNTISTTVQSKSLGEVVIEFESFISYRIPTVAKNIISHMKAQVYSIDEDKHKQITKIRSEMSKRLFPDYKISNLESLKVEVIDELSQYIAELLGCNTRNLSEYRLIPQQIEELAKISVQIKHDAKCANSSSEFWREVKGTTYDSDRHEALNYDSNRYKALAKQDDEQTSDSNDSKPYAKIAFTIAPGYSIFDHIHRKERVIVRALVYLEK